MNTSRTGECMRPDLLDVNSHASCFKHWRGSHQSVASCGRSGVRTKSWWRRRCARLALHNNLSALLANVRE